MTQQLFDIFSTERYVQPFGPSFWVCGLQLLDQENMTCASLWSQALRNGQLFLAVCRDSCSWNPATTVWRSLQSLWKGLPLRTSAPGLVIWLSPQIVVSINLSSCKWIHQPHVEPPQLMSWGTSMSCPFQVLSNAKFEIKDKKRYVLRY